jgi:hypothetical protein
MQVESILLIASNPGNNSLGNFFRKPDFRDRFSLWNAFLVGRRGQRPSPCLWRYPEAFSSGWIRKSNEWIDFRRGSLQDPDCVLGGKLVLVALGHAWSANRLSCPEVLPDFFSWYLGLLTVGSAHRRVSSPSGQLTVGSAHRRVSSPSGQPLADGAAFFPLIPESDPFLFES